MSVWDYLILALVALIAGLSVWRTVKRRKKGGCCSSCAGCAGCARAGSCEDTKTK